MVEKILMIKTHLFWSLKASDCLILTCMPMKCTKYKHEHMLHKNWSVRLLTYYDNAQGRGTE